jgi:hypothetical protein
MQDGGVQMVADDREPAHLLHYRIEEVAVHHEESAAVRGHVHRFGAHLDSAERQLQEMPAEFVVISRNVDDVRPFTRLP